MRTWKITLVATLIGTVVGFWAWEFDWTRMLWPSHPQLAGVFLTIITTVVVQLIWPKKKSKTSGG
jgi:hypothetical protein